MNVDPAAQAVLVAALADWRDGGVLGPLRSLVGEVWKINCSRYEPKRLGDDALTLAIQSSRNICNRAVGLLTGLPDTTVRGGKTLEVVRRGRVMHIGKVPSGSPAWSIDQVSWEDSDVRRESAEANSKAYTTLVGTLFEDMPPLPNQRVDPSALRHLHLSWQGFPDGGTRVWVGFPCFEPDRRWFAVALLDEPGGGGGRRTSDDQPMPPEPDHDEMPETVLPPMVRRDTSRRRAPGA